MPLRGAFQGKKIKENHGGAILSKKKRYDGWLDRNTPGLKQKLSDAASDTDLPPEVRALARVLLREHPDNKRNKESEDNEE